MIRMTIQVDKHGQGTVVHEVTYTIVQIGATSAVEKRDPYGQRTYQWERFDPTDESRNGYRQGALHHYRRDGLDALCAKVLEQASKQ